jgi:asparagine synthase (glutamine-hydrolysing)
MTCQLSHRGPDEEGIYCDGPIGLGFRRLSIIDLSNGHQPIHNEDGSIWVICNGEIYNHEALRADLQKQGHSFYTGSDIEVLLHLYERDGELFPRQLRGMFAFALWDGQKQQLLLGRDPLGIKPLLYTRQSRRLLFASQANAILQDRRVECTVDPEALLAFTQLQYVPGPRSMFSGIRKLPPGHILVCPRGGQISLQLYWEMPSQTDFKANKDERFYKWRLLELLRDSVRVRLMGDVPLGVLLSGGLDSSTIVALMAGLSDRPVKTFSVGFAEGAKYDELVHARRIAQHFGTDHQEIVVTSNDALRLLSTLLDHFDEPISDQAALPTYLVSGLASRDVTVILSGEGADELFLGYDRYLVEHLAGRLPRLPAYMRRGLFYPLLRMMPNAQQHLRALRAISTPPGVQRHLNWRCLFPQSEKKSLHDARLLEQVFVDPLPQLFAPYFTDGAPFLAQIGRADMMTWLVDDLLVKVDRMSMAHSLEARVPYLDHFVVEFAMQIPLWLKLRGGTTKYILRRVAAELLPSAIHRRKKHGFCLPLDEWLQGPLKELLLDTLSPMAIKKTGYFQHKYVTNLVRQHLHGHQRFGKQLWMLLVFHLWHQKYMQP